MIDSAKQGRRVVRLKGGDPAVFGRLAEEVTALEAGVEQARGRHEGRGERDGDVWAEAAGVARLAAYPRLQAEGAGGHRGAQQAARRGVSTP